MEDVWRKIVTTTGDEYSATFIAGSAPTIKISTDTNVATKEDLDELKVELARKAIELEAKREFSDARLKELLADKLEEEKRIKEAEEEAFMKKLKKDDIDKFINSIKKVIFTKDKTIVLWKDGNKTTVLCQEGETFDKEKGVALCIIKHIFGDISYYNEIFKSLKLDDIEVEGKAAECAPEPKKGKRGIRFIADALKDLFENI